MDGHYGSQGYVVMYYHSWERLPASIQVAQDNTTKIWDWWGPGQTTDARAVQVPDGSGNRVAATWYTGASHEFTIDVNISDGQAHQMALYCIDWDSVGRVQLVQILDASTGRVLDSRQVSNFHNGRHLVWTVSGHITIQLIWLGGANAVASGLFFD